MENASKALIIAGSMLIALMIIGALLLMFNSLSSYQDTGTKNTREAQIISFNNQYESFNRKNVRGNDLYSLLNRVVEYNRRKSSAGTGVADEGQYVAFEPMTITYTFNNQQKKLTFDDKNRIFVGEFINFSLNNLFCRKFTKIHPDLGEKSKVKSEPEKWNLGKAQNIVKQNTILYWQCLWIRL